VSAAAGPELLEVGRIGRPHGLNGEVAVSFVTDRVAERTTPGAELWAGETCLRVVSARPHRGRWLVFFEGVDDRDHAAGLTGTALRAAAVDDPDAIFVHQVVGKTVVDQHGTAHGPVASVLDNPASDLLELADGRLVPLVFVQEVDDTTVVVSVPAGLLDDEPGVRGEPDEPGVRGEPDVPGDPDEPDVSCEPEGASGGSGGG
jgi:16S rRNA processing protein RimM